MRQSLSIKLSVTFGALAALSACGGEDDPQVAAPLELVGEWLGQWANESIDESTWAGATVISYDNEDNWAITQQPADDPYNPEKFSRLVWTDVEDQAFFYCTLEFGLESAAEAEASTKVANSSDLEKGCGGAGWTELVNKNRIELHGIWQAGERVLVVRATTWGMVSLVRHSNDENWAITQNPDNAAIDPGKFNRLTWTEKGESGFSLCTVVGGLASLAEAESSSASANAADLESGCDGGPWTSVASKLAIETAGSWKGKFSDEIISSLTWNGSALAQYDNDNNRAVTLAAPDAEFGPNTYSLLVWQDISGGAFSYCTVEYGKTTFAEAWDSTTAVDADDLDSGCNGFGWTVLSLKDPDTRRNTCEIPDLPYASEVLSFDPGANAGFGGDDMPAVVLGPPMTPPAGSGSTDVVSLGQGGVIVVGFGSRRIDDGAGVDFVIFENAFAADGGPVFQELAKVEISEDGTTWYTLECTSNSETGPWAGCAGWRPTNDYDACTSGDLDFGVTGGDGFDIQDFAVDGKTLSSARYVRITDVSTGDDPLKSGAPSAGFDLDAVGLINWK